MAPLDFTHSDESLDACLWAAKRRAPKWGRSSLDKWQLMTCQNNVNKQLTLGTTTILFAAPFVSMLFLSQEVGNSQVRFLSKCFSFILEKCIESLLFKKKHSNDFLHEITVFCLNYAAGARILNNKVRCYTQWIWYTENHNHNVEKTFKLDMTSMRIEAQPFLGSVHLLKKETKLHRSYLTSGVL